MLLLISRPDELMNKRFTAVTDPIPPFPGTVRTHRRWVAVPGVPGWSCQFRYRCHCHPLLCPGLLCNLNLRYWRAASIRWGVRLRGSLRLIG